MRPNALPALLAALALSCGGSATREYQNNDLQLITAYTAQEMCSCLFVMEQTEEYCRAWTRANPQVARYRIDHARKAVQSWVPLFWGARARWTGERFGCTLEE